MIYIEHEGALFRGPAPDIPEEIWADAAKAFVPYRDAGPKPYCWGEKISAEEAALMMGTAD